MDRDELERLYDARDAADKAVRDLFEQVVVTWLEPGPPPRMPERSFSSEWVAEYTVAKVKREEAEAALRHFLEHGGRLLRG